MVAVDYHLIGKDIIRHHCVYWPAMLLSAGVELPKGWAVGGWLLSGGEKMSKTSGNVVNPLDLIDDIGLDGFRYYVLAETPYGQDGDFTVRRARGPVQLDLANNLGNLLSRVATVVPRSAPGPVPARAGQPTRGSGGGGGGSHHRRLGQRAANRAWMPRGRSSGRRTPTSRRTSRGGPRPVRPSTA